MTIIQFEADGKLHNALVGEPVQQSELVDGAMVRTVAGIDYAIYIRFGVALADDAPYAARPIVEPLASRNVESVTNECMAELESAGGFEEWDAATRNVERAARLSPTPAPEWIGAADELERRTDGAGSVHELMGRAVFDEDGSADTRALVGLLLLVVGAALVYLLWPYIVGAAVMFAGYRVATRGARRRRPRSSWSSLGRTAALMYAAWNSRWLKTSSPVRVKVHASVPPAPALELDDDGDTIPY